MGMKKSKMEIVHGLRIEHVWDLWRKVKPMARSIESGEGTLIFDDTIQEKVWTDDNKLICWPFINASRTAYAELRQWRGATALRSVNNYWLGTKTMWIGKAFDQLNAVTTVPASSTPGGGAPGETPLNLFPTNMQINENSIINTANSKQGI